MASYAASNLGQALVISKPGLMSEMAFYDAASNICQSLDISNPCLFSEMASYDVSSNIHQAQSPTAF
jgi:hypothetical protein